MKFDFTTMPDRRGMDSIAVDMNPNDFWTLPKGETKPEFDKIPMWIADMNFPTAPSVTRALERRIQHPIYGYYVPSDDFYNTIIKWQHEVHGITDLTRECIGYENGVLGGLTSALHVLCEEGGTVLTHSPTYTGFTTQLTRNEYNTILSPLKKDAQGVWRMDYEDMENKIKEYHIRVVLFCSPHNPSGRVWERWELERAMEIFERNNMYIIADEIWSDLTLFGHKHISLQSISNYARKRTVAFYSPSKTFNLAGLVGSYHVIYDAELRQRIRHYEALSHYNEMNVLFMHALIGAYSTEGQQWMAELKSVLEDNITYACNFIEKHFTGVEAYRPEGTYILLIDCAEWCHKHGKTIEQVLEDGVKVGVIWRDGSAFHVPNGIRLNLAMPHDKLIEVFNRLEKYVFI